MKKVRIAGAAIVILGLIALLSATFSSMMNANIGGFGARLNGASLAKGEITEVAERNKSAASFLKAAQTAISRAETAIGKVAAADEELALLDEATRAGQTLPGALSVICDKLAASEIELTEAVTLTEGIVSKLLGSGGALSDAIASVRAASDESATYVSKLSELIGAAIAEAREETLEPARSAIEAAQKAVGDAAAVVGAEYAPGEAAGLSERANAILEAARGYEAQAQSALAQAEAAKDGLRLGAADAIVCWLADNDIALYFTAAILLLAGLTAIFLGARFRALWSKSSVFSTFIALVALMLVQTYSMGFDSPDFGAWCSKWLDNALNVLRANSSVGMIALGMTLVIIIGGIDLAVGSTLAGVGTVVMVMIDTSSNGILGKMGLTGAPAFAISIIAGILAGAIIGMLIGLCVTKGRVPPFIVTLGAMNIVRSVAQYFTKSYTPKVPNEFTAIANTQIFGYRILPIIYWLALAAILYFVMRRTRFGRYVYAVGSNERTTRLSGINADRVKFAVYSLMGVVVALAAVIQVSRTRGVDVASAGLGYELDSIAAVVVGGTSMSGGRGSILGTVIGVLIIGVMNNLLILLGADSFLTDAFKGAIVVAAVLMQRKQAA